MKVILTSDIKNVGKKGEIINVKEGYYNNFLLPNGKAVMASGNNMKNLEATIKNAQLREQKEKSKVEEISKSLKDFNYIIKTKSGPSGKLFGSITASDVAKLIKNLTKYEIDKRKIEIEGNGIKTIGSHDVKLKLHAEVETSITVNVEATE
jgi:large subunit ribosomal protein L9